MSEKFKVELMYPEETTIDIIKAPESKREDIVVPYAFCIKQSCCVGSKQDINFKKINKAIIEKWSINALNYIKEKAWKLVEGERK